MATILFKDGASAKFDASRVQGALAGGWSVTDDPAVEFDKDDVGRLANYLHALVVKGLTYQVKDMGDKIFVTLTGGY